MQKLVTSFLFLCGLVLAPLLVAAPAEAQASRTWVSGVGDDVNPCSRTAPCKTFAGAISKTAVNGEINCLDPGGFGAVTITKSITIDCHEVFASVLAAGTNGINIPFDSFNVADLKKTVRLRNLNFNGITTGLRGIQITGATNSAGSEVFIEDCMVDGFQSGSGNGIADTRVNGGKLFITNTTIRNSSGSNIQIAPASGTVKIDAVLKNVISENSAVAGLTANGGAKVTAVNSNFSGNAFGLDIEGASTEASADGSIFNSNTTGLLTVGGATLRLSNNDIGYNTTNINGPTQSFGNNRIVGAAGTVPTLIGAVTNDHGQN